MNPTTLEVREAFDTLTTYQAARRLQDQALAAYYRLGELAEAGDKKARRLEDLAWYRYNRRTGLVNYAADLHWGSL